MLSEARGSSFLDQDVRAIGVTIRDKDILGARLERAADRRVDIFRHDAAEACVFKMPGGDLIPGGYAGNTFHISSDENFHKRPPI